MSYVLVATAAAGLLKSQLIDKQKEARDRKLAAATQRYSPWTGLKAGDIKEADPLGSAISFASTGAQIQNGIQQRDINQKLADRALQGGGGVNFNMNAGGAQSPYMGMTDEFKWNPQWRGSGYGG